MISFGSDNSAEKYCPFIRKIEENDGNEIKFIVSLACKGDKEKEADLQNIENEAIREIFSKSTMLCPDEKNT